MTSHNPVYDWDNRLTEATVIGTTTDYAYLGDDTRQSRTVGAATTDYLYDRTGGLPQVVDDGTNSYLHDVTGDLASIDGTGEPTYPLQDGLGSVRLTVDDTGTALGTREWDAWGNQRSSTGSGYAFGWAGEQYDASSDLTYLRARYYSPGTGQFLSRDMVQPNAGGTTGYNPYSYANGNPVTFIDPGGHFVSYEEFGGGPFAYLAYVLECYLSGSCLYQGQHATIEWELEKSRQPECGARSFRGVRASAFSAFGPGSGCPRRGLVKYPTPHELRMQSIGGDSLYDPPLDDPCGATPQQINGLNRYGPGPWGSYTTPTYGAMTVDISWYTFNLDVCHAGALLAGNIRAGEGYDTTDAVWTSIGVLCASFGVPHCGVLVAGFKKWMDDDASKVNKFLAEAVAHPIVSGVVLYGDDLLFDPSTGPGRPLVWSQHEFYVDPNVRWAINPCYYDGRVAPRVLGQFNSDG